jgi:hypothetical protein
MPKRTKLYIGKGKTLVNGGRVEIAKNGMPSTVLKAIEPAVARAKVADFIDKFDELSQLQDRDRFIDDLIHECASAQTMRLDSLVKGTRTKPDEWTAQILVHGLSVVMQRHGLKAALSQYEHPEEVRRSLYLRLIPGLLKIAGLRSPGDLKGLALRAKRIT